MADVALASPRRCLVAVCTNLPVVPAQTAQSLMELGWGSRIPDAKRAHGFEEIAFYWAAGFPRVDALRDSVAELALREDFSHLLFLDADMVWPTDLLVRMLAHHDAGIVGGLYVMRNAPYAPIALRDGVVPDGSTVTQYFHDLDATTSGAALRPVEVLGMGCTLIPTQVFRDIGPRPWFYYVDDDQGWPRVTEDVPFCQAARVKGWGLWLDPTIRCGHVASMVIDYRWHDRWQQAYAASVEHVRVTMTERAPVLSAEGV